VADDELDLSSISNGVGKHLLPLSFMKWDSNGIDSAGAKISAAVLALGVAGEPPLTSTSWVFCSESHDCPGSEITELDVECAREVSSKASIEDTTSRLDCLF
jgi:hypothetical protein